jgi:hypothetical protein
MPETLSHALRELWNPQYQHVVLMPFFVHGLVLMGLMVLASTVLKQTRAGALALLLLALCAVSVIPYLQARGLSLTSIQGAHTKYEATEIAAVGERLRSLAWLYYAVAGLALVALVASLSKPGLGMLFGVLAGLAGLGAGMFGLDAHFRESRIYHPNLIPASVQRPNLPNQAAPAPTRVQPARPVQPAGR